MEHRSDIITTTQAPKPIGLFPHAWRAGNLLFLSGQGPGIPGTDRFAGVELDAAGNIVTYDFEAQCRAVFDNVRRILEASGSRWERIVDVTVFLTNMRDDFPVFNRLYTECFRDHPAPPARTTVEINRAPTPIAIELKIIATVE